MAGLFMIRYAQRGYCIDQIGGRPRVVDMIAAVHPYDTEPKATKDKM